MSRSALLSIYGRSKRLIAPTLAHSQQVYEQVLREHVTPGSVWLDLGCGHQILPAWREAEERLLVKNCEAIVGLDYDMPSLKAHRNISLRVRGDIGKLPFKQDTFDLVTANMVVEHLDDPAIQFREVQRVLKPNGIFIFHTPNAHGYFTLMRRMVPEIINKQLVQLLDGREAGDIFEIQYKANTRKQIDLLAADVGLDVIKLRLIVTDAVFSVVPPIMLFELMWIRALMTKPLEAIRTNIIGILKKPNQSEAVSSPEPIAYPQH
jgi:ubiquinone/menaquinone biosynthesis C-methylase UbiE